MRARIVPGRPVGGTLRVPGDKSIAHRWLILAATADGHSHLRDLPAALDVRATASCLASIAPGARPSLEAWARAAPAAGEEPGFTWDPDAAAKRVGDLEVEGDGRVGLRASPGELDCGNSGTTMRLLAGVLAATGFRSVLTGDESLRVRPMERVAEPLRRMGAAVRTTDGHAPIEIHGAPLRGIVYRPVVPSAQVKSAVLLAGIAAEGETVVEESAPTRDHTERALAALGAPVAAEPGRVRVGRFQHAGFEGRVPGDLSSAAFLVAAAALTGSGLVVEGVGLNPSRAAVLDVMRRMGVPIEVRVRRAELGEPVGDVSVGPVEGLRGTTVEASELPLVIDEVPVLTALAAHARGESWFVGAGELRVKESDRLTGLAEGLRGLGGHAAVEADDLVVAGGGLPGGSADAGGDHRMAMALCVAALAGEGPSVVGGLEWAEVSFPGFAATLRGLGADLSAEDA